jgi:hypothetical protein
MIRHIYNLKAEAERVCIAFLQSLELSQYFNPDKFERIFSECNQISNSAQTIGTFIADEIIRTAQPQPLPEYD